MYKMNFIKLLFVLGLSIEAYSANHDDGTFSLFQHVVVTATGGPIWISPGEYQQISYNESDFFNTYLSKSNSQINGFGELFVGLQNTISNHLDGQFGAAISGAGMAKMQGQVWQYGLPEFYNDSYTYNLNQFRVALRGKLLPKCQIESFVKPYITGSVGVGFNRSFSYMDTPLLESIVPSNNFLDNTQTAFTYTFGAGLQTNIYKNLYFGVGYEFMDWGKSTLGNPSAVEASTVLGMNHLYSNMLQFSLSYIA